MVSKKESNVTELKKTPKKSATKKVNTDWPKVEKGSHLTVTTYENGRTELAWDDAALTRDVHNAIMQYEQTQKIPKANAKSNAKLKRVK